MKKAILREKIKNLPQAPGVYVFCDAKKEILYIGKATNLRSRVQSYFREGESQRLIGKMIHKISDLEFHQTDSVLEALILESNLIKKHQPKYNIDLKDDKSFSYFVITKEEFPKVLIFRKTDIDEKKLLTTYYSLKSIFGPYTSKKQMEIALKIIRKIFPFHSLKAKTEKGCLDFQLGRCPGPYAGAISKEDYAKNIRAIKMILEGKKKGLVKRLEIEMRENALKQEFEKAAELRNKIYALQHIRDIALMGREFDTEEFTKKLMPKKLNPVRIEAYDISNISGKNAVGSMVVFEGENPNKAEYRKFKIKFVKGINDVGMMREVLARRFGSRLTRLDYKVPSPSKGEGNKEKTSKDWPASTRGDDRSSTRGWPRPDLILLDGGQGHLNAIVGLFEVLKFEVPVVAVAKGKSRKNLNFQFPISNKILMSKFSKEIHEILNDKNLIKNIMDEAHRFAISFHRKKRREELLS